MAKETSATIQIFANGQWIDAGTFEATGVSHENGGYFEYDPDYAISNMTGGSLATRVGLRYPVNFDLYHDKRWPAFLLDILPSGAGRRVWAKRLGISEDHSSDWQLLTNGAGNAPGNIRIREAVILPNEQKHPGFTKDEVVSKNADFIEYAEAMGAVVAGATDVAGDAPKFLLVRDKAGRWHPDGALKDEEVQNSWLVKFPRGKKEADYTVLRNEAPYYEVARRFGVRTGQQLEFIEDALFIPRFDRVPGNPFVRHGLETIASAAGISQFGVRTYHLDLCKVIAEFATNPSLEIKEYLRREILNSALRNTDNHARNTSFIKRSDGTVELSPLYDFAPMFLDPGGIARASVWGPDIERNIGLPDWITVGKTLGEIAGYQQDLMVFLATFAEPVRNLPAIMNQFGVEQSVIEGVATRCSKIAEDLSRVGKE